MPCEKVTGSVFYPSKTGGPCIHVSSPYSGYISADFKSSDNENQSHYSWSV